MVSNTNTNTNTKGNEIKGQTIVFQNWAQTFGCRPTLYFEPSNETELAWILQEAQIKGKTVKVVGSGHSPSDIACTDGYLVSLKRMNKLISVNNTEQQITVEAGITLQEIHHVARTHGFQLSNMGSISEQSLSGAIATGTHGTGANFGILATLIVNIRLMKADAQVIFCSPTSNSDIFYAALCSLGALGIILTLTLQLEKVVNLKIRQLPTSLDHVLANLEQLQKDSEHFRFFYFPRTKHAVTYDVDRTTKSVTRNNNSWWHDQFLGHHVLETVLWMSSYFPSLVPIINKKYFDWLYSKPLERVDINYKIMNFDCLFQQYVNEWAIPSEHAAAALQELRKFIDFHQVPAHFPIEVRFTKADNIWLSPCYGRNTCFIGIIMYRPFGKDIDIEKYWRGYENIMLSFHGRPHWAKAHLLGPKELANAYPKFGDFLRLRKQLDPNGLFLNNYLRRHLLGQPLTTSKL